MKKEFFESVIEIIYFDKQDVITSSQPFELEDDVLSVKLPSVNDLT